MDFLNLVSSPGPAFVKVKARLGQVGDSQWHHVLVVGLMTLILDWVYLIGCSKFVFNSM